MNVFYSCWGAMYKIRIIFIMMIFFSSNLLAASQANLKKAAALNNSASEKIKAHNLDGAELDLLAALEYAGQNPKLKKNLGVVYYEKGVRDVRAGDFYGAQNFLKQALEIEPENSLYSRAFAEALAVQAAREAKDGRIESALELYEKAARHDKGNIHIWIQASHYAWMTHRMDKAREYLSRAGEIDAKDENCILMEKKLAGFAGEPVLSRNESEHFILSAAPYAIGMIEEGLLLEDLEKAYNDVSYRLDFSPKSKMTVVFYTAGDFRDHWKLPFRVSGYYDGKLRIPYLKGEVSFEALKPIIIHELTHAFVNAMARGPIPKWLNEGLAQWMEGRKIDTESKDLLVTLQIKGRVTDIERLDSVFAAQHNSYSDTEMTLVYMKAFSLVEYLIQEFGLWSVVQTIKEYEPAPMDEVIYKKYFHGSLREIQERWLRWLEQKKIE